MGAWLLLTMGVNATLLIKNGHVHDGTGAPAFHGDIAIDGETIVAVGDPGTLHVSGEPRVIDAEGMLVCPGWVDVHTHCGFNMSAASVLWMHHRDDV